MKSSILKLAVATILAFVASVGSAQAASITVGNAVVDRSTADTWSNFVLALPSESFTTAAVVTNWSVFTNTIGDLGLLILRAAAGSNYQVIGADFETIASVGFNSFTFNADTGTSSVMAGDILGLYIGSAKVDFDYIAGGTAKWCGSSGCITDVNTQLAAGQEITFSGGPQDRVYSVNASAVPLPAAAWLFGSALIGLVAVARRKAVV